MSSRRNFLKTSAGFAATLAVNPLAGAQTPAPAGSLPKVRFGGVEITRMVMGCNQFYGYSHFNGLLDLATGRFPRLAGCMAAGSVFDGTAAFPAA